MNLNSEFVVTVVEFDLCGVFLAFRKTICEKFCSALFCKMLQEHCKILTRKPQS